MMQRGTATRTADSMGMLLQLRLQLLLLCYFIAGEGRLSSICAASETTASNHVLSPLQKQIAAARRRVATELRRQHIIRQHRQRQTSTVTGSTITTTVDDGRRVTIECHTEPLFKCRSCHDDLIAEQEAVMEVIRSKYREATLVESTYKLLNTLYVKLPVTEDDDDEGTIDLFLLQIPGVINVYPSEDWELHNVTVDEQVDALYNDTTTPDLSDGVQSNDVYSKPLRDIGVDVAARAFCATGKGVRVAVLDGGVDYTHKSFGGAGTIEAYQAAYGTNIADVRNRQRDGLFPTGIVTDGYDFLGDRFRDGDASLYAIPDNDPIDLAGHGTGVAHAVRAVAPQAEIIAVKICTTTGNTCPDFAFVRAMEYILDPNLDGSLDDSAHIVNLSLGRPYASSYYSVLAKATEEVFALGVLPILAAGNSGNLPFILGGAPATPNALTVGATSVYEDATIPRTMATYSSRGPGGSNLIKPDMVAPGGPYGLAQAASGDKYRSFQGTSFAAPLVAGGAALIKQKCPECSPFAIKAILMNHGHHGIRYSQIDNSTAPVTLQGSGEMQLQRSLAATFWAYSTNDMNPSLSLGLINAAGNMVIQRRIRIVKLSDEPEIVSLGYEFRSSLHAAAVSVQFTPETLTLDGDCQGEFFVDVEFQINASKAPSNHMYSGGEAGNDARNLDFNEVDGWLLLTSASANQEVGVPFHMIIRKAADVTIEISTFNDQTLSMTKLPMDLTVNIKNLGAETAQIDVFQLLYISSDKLESEYGANDPPADLRYVGYRTVPVNLPGCTDLIEFAIQTWESQLSLTYTHFNAWFDLDFDEDAEHTVYNSAYQFGSTRSEMRRINMTDQLEYCVGYPPDHATNTANTVLRFCSEDIGMEAGGIVNVAVSSFSFPHDNVSDMMEYRNITIPLTGLSAPSYDIQPGSTLNDITISGTGTTPGGFEPLGLLLLTNSYRSTTKTGSSTRASEALVITRDGTLLPQEITPDLLVYPVPQDLVGPSCSWQNAPSQCNSRMLTEHAATTAIASLASVDIRSSTFDLDLDREHVRDLQSEKICPEFPVTRLKASNIESSSVTNGSTPTEAPSLRIAEPTKPPPSSSFRTENPTIATYGTSGATVPPLPINDHRATSSASHSWSASVLRSLVLAAVASFSL